MSKVSIQGDASGTGTLTIAAPNTNSNYTLTLPTNTGTVMTSASDVAASQIVDALNATGSAPIYACRAWVNFNGTGTVAIRASGNVSSITDRGTGRYTINLTTALPDANGSVVAGVSANGTTGDKNRSACCNLLSSSTATANCYEDTTESDQDLSFVQISIFR